jgi:hypothetical protein
MRLDCIVDGAVGEAPVFIRTLLVALECSSRVVHSPNSEGFENLGSQAKAGTACRAPTSLDAGGGLVGGGCGGVGEFFVFADYGD